MRAWRGWALIVLSGFLPALGHADAALERCAAEPEDSERLKCYDRVAGRKEPATAAKGLLTERWKLDRQNLRFTDIQTYRPTYVIARMTNRANERPASPAPGHAAAGPQDFDNSELKFQLSFKTELVSPDRLPADNLRLWLAYTQQSNWQIANSRNSSPFRENNYEPELILTYGNRDKTSHFKLVNVGIYSHQSNGKSGPDSRSWHRSYVQGGWEWDDFSVLARGWWRWPESGAEDDNPDLTRNIGRGDVVLDWRFGDGWRASLLARHNLRLRQGRGFGQLDLSGPRRMLGGAARLHFQLTSGYGESLIDYNHDQTTVGIGLSFGDW